jgi:hypothetical protein
MRRAGLLTLLIVAVLCAVVVGGCGGGDATSVTVAPGVGSEEPAPDGGAPQSAEPAGAAAKACGPDSLKATGVGCGEAKAVAAKWRAAPGCAVVPGDSHASCQVRGFLCIAAAVGQGTAVSCALPGESVVFLDQR